MSKNNKSNPKSKTKNRDSQSVSQDMWQALFTNPSPNTQASGSSSQQPQYAAFPSIAQPFNLAPDDPRNNYQHPGWYQNTQNTQWSPQQPQYHHTQWSQSTSNPHFSPNTSNPYFHQTNFTVPQTLEESSDEAQPENEPEEEFEPEDEPEDEDPKKSKKRGKKPVGEPKRRQLRWLDEEARILAERWIHCSENGVQGRNQTNDSFWAKVQAGYNSCVAASRQRNLNQLTGKWNKISHDSKTFQSIYKHYKEIQPQSGADENDVLTAARKAFRKQVKRAFIYESSWNVLKHYPKFFAEPGVMANEDTFQPFVTDLDMDEEPVHSALASNMKRLFQDDYIRRPVGRKASKSAASSSAGSSSRSVHSEKIDTLEAVKQTALAQQEAIKLIKENAMKKAAYKAISFLAKTLGNKPSKKEIKMIKTARQEVVSQYEQQYAAGESEKENEEENANNNGESGSD